MATFAELPLPGISFKVPPAAPEPGLNTAPPPGATPEEEPGPGPPSPTPLSVLAILNPLSRQTQRAGPLLAWLRSAFGADLHVVLNPVHELQKPPLDAYYRLVLPDPSASGTVCFSQTPLPAQTAEMDCLVLNPVHGVMKPPLDAHHRLVLLDPSNDLAGQTRGAEAKVSQGPLGCCMSLASHA